MVVLEEFLKATCFVVACYLVVLALVFFAQGREVSEVVKPSPPTQQGYPYTRLKEAGFNDQQAKETARIVQEMNERDIRIRNSRFD